MKKLMTIMLGLAFVTGTVAIAKAEETAPKSEKKKKGGKKKAAPKSEAPKS